jgi:hypothetical protein
LALGGVSGDEKKKDGLVTMAMHTPSPNMRTDTASNESSGKSSDKSKQVSTSLSVETIETARSFDQSANVNPNANADVNANAKWEKPNIVKLEKAISELNSEIDRQAKENKKKGDAPFISLNAANLCKERSFLFEKAEMPNGNFKSPLNRAEVTAIQTQTEQTQLSIAQLSAAETTAAAAAVIEPLNTQTLANHIKNDNQKLLMRNFRKLKKLLIERSNQTTANRPTTGKAFILFSISISIDQMSQFNNNNNNNK